MSTVTNIVTNKAMVRGYIERALNEQRLELAEEYIAEDIVQHPAGRAAQRGREGMKVGVGMLFRAFPDFHLTIDDEIAEDDRVAIRYTFRGTHQGEIMGIPKTGKQITLTGMAIYRLDNGKVVEFWNAPDELSLMRLLGIIPTPAHEQIAERAVN